MKKAILVSDIIELAKQRVSLCRKESKRGNKGKAIIHMNAVETIEDVLSLAVETDAEYSASRIETHEKIWGLENQPGKIEMCDSIDTRYLLGTAQRHVRNLNSAVQKGDASEISRIFSLVTACEIVLELALRNVDDTEALHNEIWEE